MAEHDVRSVDRCALGEELCAEIRQVVEEALLRGLARASDDASAMEGALRRSIIAVRDLEGDVDDLASRAYDIEHSLKSASSWACSLDEDVERMRRR